MMTLIIGIMAGFMLAIVTVLIFVAILVKKGFFIHHRADENFRREAENTHRSTRRGSVYIDTWFYAGEWINPIHLPVSAGYGGVFSIAERPWCERIQLRWYAFRHFLAHPCAERWWALRFDVYATLGI